jgi:hypothetical protein
VVGKCASEACGEATGFTRWCWAAGECFIRAPSPRGIAHGLRYPPFAPLPFNIPMVSATPASPLHPPPKSVQRRNLCMFLHLRPHKGPGPQKLESGERGVAGIIADLTPLSLSPSSPAPPPRHPAPPFLTHHTHPPIPLPFPGRTS